MLDLDLYCDLLRDLINRLKSDDPRVRDAAERDYERCARAPNFAAALIGHVAAALSSLRHEDRLNLWEVSFANSMVHVRCPSQRQLETLAAIFVKAHAGPRRRAAL